MKHTPKNTLQDRLKQIRTELGISQAAIGAQGFVSTPGWIKIENGQRQASEKLIDKLLAWMVKDKYIPAGASAQLRQELLILKYINSSSAFVRKMAQARLAASPPAATLVVAPRGVIRQGRPPKQDKA